MLSFSKVRGNVQTETVTPYTYNFPSDALNLILSAECFLGNIFQQNISSQRVRLKKQPLRGVPCKELLTFNLRKIIKKQLSECIFSKVAVPHQGVWCKSLNFKLWFILSKVTIIQENENITMQFDVISFQVTVLCCTFTSLKTTSPSVVEILSYKV